MTNTHKPRIWTRDFISIAISNFFIFVVFYDLLTLLPVYVVDGLKETEAKAGLVITIFLLSAIFVRPFSGKIIDLLGKKKALLIGMSLFALSSFLYVWTDDFYLLMGLRFFHGVWFSIVTTVAGAIAADIVPNKRRGEGLGYFAMSMNLAMVFGPFIALTLNQYVSFEAIYVLFGIIMVIGVLLSLFVKVPAQAQPAKVKAKLTFDDLFERSVFPIAIVGSLLAFTYSSIISYISIFAKSLGLMDAAGFFFVVFAVAILVSRPFTGRMFDIKGPASVIMPAFVIFSIGMITLSFTQTSWMLLLSGALIGLGYGTIVPSFQTLAVQSAENHRSAHATATFFTLFDTGIASGSFVIGIVVVNIGYQNLYMIGGFFILGIMMLYKLVQQKRTEKESYEARMEY
ncbi:MFS transporter [Pseudalkalibacillus caeni]|uniref:MFS transporter n=1 Tax=Exobacillus caeni TaxID=2574798 RepID=A0A5R9F9F8_9BACL|nr:MFS transporter [Pseudalkalibacillus caeni]TLS37184.1 MFS transporter [Pseudalkalibacillus caeni]